MDTINVAADSICISAHVILDNGVHSKGSDQAVQIRKLTLVFHVCICYRVFFTLC